MLDLRVLNSGTYPMTLMDGEVINIRRADQGMLDEMAYMSKRINQGVDEISAMDELFGYLAKIMSRNIEGNIYTKEQVKAMVDFMVAAHVILDYSAWTRKIINDPN